MLFNSVNFLIFFPFVCIVYFAIPHRFRHIFLLFASYFFYMCWNPKYALLMLTSTVITYFSGILLNRAEEIADEQKRQKYKRMCVALSFGSNLLILFLFKYLNFTTRVLGGILAKAGIMLQIPQFDIILPVGISFYTFQALSYTMDVYRKEIEPERNFLKYALFVSFFPQLVAGPIERSKNLIHQVSEYHELDYLRIRKGLLRMLYGLFQKVVLSEYLALVVDNVYNAYTEKSGFQLMIATIAFAFQIYNDFGSYSNIAIGAAQVMGFTLMDNFDTPYFSRSVAEFWRRWHISLSSWFKDYLYIPLGGSRKGFVRKQINKMIVFLVSGLWHGASGHFVIWGFLNGFYQVVGEVLMPFRKNMIQALKIKEESVLFKCWKMLITFVMIDFSWIFFRIGTGDGLRIVKKILYLNHNWVIWGTNLEAMGLNTKTIWVLLIALLVMTIVDIFRYNKKNLLDVVEKKGILIRWVIYYGLLFGILIFGIYGPGFDASQFIYFQF